MNFFEAISSGFRNYVGFSGRAIRSEYWYWVLFTLLLGIVTAVLDLVIFSAATASGFSPLNVIASLATLLPSLAVGIRRLHDRDQTGWWILLALIPVIGWIILIIWYCLRGTVGPNSFGPDPLQGKV
jgi:uncharacterized membrane protein YhaH (DUF805 family)